MQYDLLPIGSVVSFSENKNIKFMIVGYFPTNKSGERKDYTAVRYPMGVYDNRLFFFFNHSAIAETFHTGYTDNEFEVMMTFVREAEFNDS